MSRPPGFRATALYAALLAAGASLILTAGAMAGTVSFDGKTVQFVDPVGAGDDLTVDLETLPIENDADRIGGWRVSFLQYDPETSPGPGCMVGFVSAICPSGAAPPAALAIDLGDGNDELELISNTVAASTRTTVLGGGGDDLIVKYQTSATIDGGAGNDTIRPDDRPSALALPPEPSPGDVIGGGAGVDAVNYDNALDSISVSLDGKPNDGRAGERDNILPSVENIIGSQYGGTLVGSPAANDIVGGSGRDLLIGAGGRDELDGGSGNDTINALDAAGGDLIDCGDGADLVYADAGDTIATQDAAGGAPCEKVVWAPAIASTKLRKQDGRIAVSLRCPGPSGTCRGTLRLTTAKKKPKTVAGGGYRVGSGKRTTVWLKPGGRSSGNGSQKGILFVQPKGAAAPAGRAVTVRGG